MSFVSWWVPQVLLGQPTSCLDYLQNTWWCHGERVVAYSGMHPMPHRSWFLHQYLLSPTGSRLSVASAGSAGAPASGRIPSSAAADKHFPSPLWTGLCQCYLATSFCRGSMVLLRVWGGYHVALLPPSELQLRRSFYPGSLPGLGHSTGPLLATWCQPISPQTSHLDTSAAVSWP